MDEKPKAQQVKYFFKLTRVGEWMGLDSNFRRSVFQSMPFSTSATSQTCPLWELPGGACLKHRFQGPWSGDKESVISTRSPWQDLAVVYQSYSIPPEPFQLKSSLVGGLVCRAVLVPSSHSCISNSWSILLLLIHFLCLLHCAFEHAGC